MKQKPTPATDLELRVIDHAKRGLGPSASQRRLTLDRLATALGSLPSPMLTAAEPPPPETPIAPEPPAPSTLGAPGAGSASHLGRVSLPTLIASVLTAAGVGFGAGVLAGSANAPSTAPLAARTSNEHTASALDTTPSAMAKPLAPPPRATSAFVTKPQGSRPPLGAERSPAQPPPSASSAPAKATFYEELSYVRRAQSALRQGNATLALGLMQSLDEIQPSGALMAERRMTRVLALCQLDRTAEATEIARDMLSSDGTAEVYRRRLAGSCAGAGLHRGSEHESAVKDPLD